MKYRLFLIGLLLSLFVLSCEEDKDANDFCINTILNDPKTNILSEVELNEIKSLFLLNNMDYSYYQFYSLLTDELGYHHIKCYQFYQNMRIFTGDLIFHFDKEGKYYFLSGELISKIDVDLKPNQHPNIMINKYIRRVNDDEYYSCIDSCFDIEPGYYDLKAGTSYAGNSFIKAWKIKPSGKRYPFAIINDLNSRIVYYDNGIRF